MTGDVDRGEGPMAKTPQSAPESSGRRIAAVPIDFTTLPSRVSYEVVPLTAEDGAGSRGFLYTRGGEKTVVCFMHPRADMSRHYAMPSDPAAGYAPLCPPTRHLNHCLPCLPAGPP